MEQKGVGLAPFTRMRGVVGFTGIGIEMIALFVLPTVERNASLGSSLGELGPAPPVAKRRPRATVRHKSQG